MKQNIHNTYKMRILKAQMYMQEHLQEEITLENLAEISHFSKYHFHRIFKAITGETVKAYIRRLRLERAIMRLQYTDISILDIALEAGYQSHEAFSRVVREQYALTPTKIRELETFSPQLIEPINLDTLEKYKMNVEIKNIPDIPVVFKRHVGPYENVSPLWSELMQWAHQSDFLAKNPNAKRIAIAYDDPNLTAEDKLRYDACLSYQTLIELPPEVHTQIISGGKYAVATHQGSYDNIKDAFSWMFGTWLAESGEEPADKPAFNIYKNNPLTTPEKELLCDLYIPLV